MRQPSHRLFESYLEDHILVQYDGDFRSVTWTAHNQIGPDNMAHYFTSGDHEYVLVWSDFPNDSFAHSEGHPVHVRGASSQWLRIPGNDIYSGSFALYKIT